MNIGDNVTFKAPFNAAYPGVYTIEAAATSEAADTWLIRIDDITVTDVHEDNLELAS
jgi:hypothetical protein